MKFNNLIFGINILLKILFLFICPFQSLAYENFNECETFQSYFLTNKNIQSLDEKEMIPYKTNGLNVRYFEDDKRYEIEKIHPDLRNSLQSKKIDLRIGENIISINGKETFNLSEESFDKEFDSENVIIKTDKTKDSITLEKKDYYFFDLMVAVDIKNISEINSKDSYIQSDFFITKLWHDTRLAEIAFKVWKKAIIKDKSAEVFSFYCDIDKIFKKNYELPKILIKNFTAKIPNKIIENSFHYYPKTMCESEDSECTAHEKKFGRFELTEKIKYSGKLSQEFDFTSFPFDSQNVELIIQSDNYAFEKEDHTYFTDLYFSSYSDRKLETSYANLNNNSWDYTNYYYYHGSQYIDEIDNRIADLAVGFKIERKYIFYVFKIFFPIIFILIISFSVFWINPKELESRVTISIVCLLSLIAYNYIIDQDIPKLGYLTLLDKVIFISYLFAGVPTLQTVVVRNYFDNSNAERSMFIDKFSKTMFPISFAILIIIMFLSEIYS